MLCIIRICLPYELHEVLRAPHDIQNRIRILAIPERMHSLGQRIDPVLKYRNRDQ